MRRGEIWTAAGTGYASKPRPVVLVQSDDFENLGSAVVCLVTSTDTVEGPSRVALPANVDNGLDEDSVVMADKTIAMRREHLGEKLGTIGHAKMREIEAALRSVLGLS